MFKMAASMQMVCLDDFEAFATNSLPRNALDYYRSGANDQYTLKDNREAFKRSTGDFKCVFLTF